MSLECLDFRRNAPEAEADTHANYLGLIGDVFHVKEAAVEKGKRVKFSVKMRL